jgi:hypothetical protein
VQVAQPSNFGTAAVPVLRRGVESNVAAFVLAPKIKTTPIPDTPPNSTLQLEITPSVGRTQRVALLIGDQTISISPRPLGDPDPAATLSFPIPSNFLTGTYLLRVQIDGAESPLEVDGTGLFVSPTIKIT